MARTKTRNPSLIGALFLGVLSLLLGGLLGIYNLLRTPVDEVSSMPKPEEVKPDAVYFLRGGDKGKSNWALLRSQMEAAQPGTSLTLTETDLNQWAKKHLVLPAPKQGEKPLNLFEMKGFDVEVTPLETNFRISGSQLFVGFKFLLPQVYGQFPIVCQATGDFTRQDGELVFRTHSLRFNHLPVPPQGNAPALVQELLLQVVRRFPEYSALFPSWQKLANASLEGSRLILTF